MRLKPEVRNALKALAGKRGILFEDIPRGISALFECAEKLRTLNVIFGSQSRAYFGFDFGIFSADERMHMAQYHSDAKLEGKLALSLGRVELVFPQIVPLGTACKVVPAILKSHTDDLLGMDEIISTIRCLPAESEPRPRLFAESPDPAFMRPPGVPLN